MEPRLKSTRLIDGEVKGIMDNFVSPVVNPPILAAGKVQNSKNITEGDSYIKAMLITASFSMIKLWNSILKND